jgi:hypothetical protein
MGMKTSLLLNYKFKLYGHIIFLVFFALLLIELLLIKHKLSESYFLYVMVFGLFISAVSREKKETNRTIITRYRSFKVLFTISIPTLLLTQLLEMSFSIKIQINLVYIALIMMLVYKAFYIYYTVRSKKKEEADL